MSSFLPISLDYLKPGNVLADDIYSEDGKLLLIKKGSPIHVDTIERLTVFNTIGNICIKVADYTSTSHSEKKEIKQYKQKYIEDSVGYTQLKNSTDNFLKNTKFNEDVKVSDVAPIKKEIFTKINTSSLEEVFQCINAPRPVDEYLQRHSVNVGMLNGIIGKWLGIKGDELEDLILAGVLHDVGKTKVPSSILDAPRKLTDEEFTVVKKHPEYSFELLKDNINFSQRVKDAAKYHHERTDGKGYPEALKGNDIPYFAKITAVSDVYDAMVAKRSYKAEHSPLSILAKFKTRAFSGLDEELCQLFTNNMPLQFIGTKVLMVDGTLGEIVHILSNDLEYPIVKVDNKLRQADKEWDCVKLIVIDEDEKKKEPLIRKSAFSK